MPPHRPRPLSRMGILRLLLYVTPALGQDNQLPGHLRGSGGTLWVVRSCRCGSISRKRPSHACMHAGTNWVQISEGRDNLTIRCFDPVCDEPVFIAKYSRATHTAATINCGRHEGR